MISVSRIPKDQTSDLMVKVPKLMASGAVHLMGNLAPAGTESTWLSGSRSLSAGPSEAVAARRRRSKVKQATEALCHLLTLLGSILVVLNDTRQTKVCNLADQSLVDQDVGSTQVPVDVIPPFDVSHALCNLGMHRVSVS